MKWTDRKNITTHSSWITVDVYGKPQEKGLVVMPGVLSDADSWRHVDEAITYWPSGTVINRRGRAPSGPLTQYYAVHTEIDDLLVAIHQIGGAAAVFGWSYGGLIALLAANQQSIGHVIAYEPVSRPFGGDSLSRLKEATEHADWEKIVEIVNRDISGFPESRVTDLRSDSHAWNTMKRLSKCVYYEVKAINDQALPSEIAQQAHRIDLLLGQANSGTAPYGTAFTEILRHVPRAHVSELPEQGHLAHVENSLGLAHAIDSIAREKK